MVYADWEIVDIDPLKVDLDPLNPRLDLGEGPSQTQIIQHMVDKERITELMKLLIKHGFNKAEPVTIVQNGKGYIVIEGNRRLAACKLLLNKKLVPKGVKIPEVDKTALKRLSKIPAVLAPSRGEAGSYIVQRHVSGGPRPWSTEARLRAVMNLYNNGMKVTDIVAELGLKKAQVESSIKEYKLISYVKSLPCWTKQEKAAFSIKTNPFTRFFSTATKDKSRSAGEIIGLQFNKDYEVAPTGNKKEFDRYLEAIARGFLILPTRFNTRTGVDEVFEKVGHPSFSKPDEDANNSDPETVSSDPTVTSDANAGNISNVNIAPENVEVSQPAQTVRSSNTIDLNDNSAAMSEASSSSAQDQQSSATDNPITNITDTEVASLQSQPPETLEAAEQEPTAQGRRPKKHKPKPFLKGLRCSVKNDVLSSLTEEINEIDYEQFPMAAAMLTRTLIHASLLHLFKEKGREKALREFGFLDVLRRTVGEQAKLFDDHNRSDFVTVIQTFLNGKFKDYLDKIVHPNHIIKCTPGQVEDIGEQFRALLEYILDRRSYQA